MDTRPATITCAPWPRRSAASCARRTWPAATGVALRTTASIGVAVHPRHGARDVAGLLRHADEALYRAKRAGRDCVVPYAA